MVSFFSNKNKFDEQNRVFLIGTHCRELSAGVRQYADKRAILCEKCTEIYSRFIYAMKLFVIPFILLHSFIYNFMGTFVVKLLCILFLAVPAVSTKLAAVNFHCIQHIVQTIKTK